MPLTRRERDRILINFYDAQQNYEKLASEIRRFIDEDSPSLKDALYTVKHRLKDRDRLLQKIDQLNAKPKKRATLIEPSNFQDRIEDLLGIRIICLRYSDLSKVKRFLDDLADEKKIKVLRGPIDKKTFLIRPGGPDAAKDLQYSGYSSVHYVIKLGREASPLPQIANLKAELQLRTILEEAWGEIDHKYRYELKRGGTKVPAHIDAGFRDLSLYLQAAARHVEHLCEDIQRLRVEPRPTRQQKAKGVPSAPGAAQIEMAPAPPTTAPPADNPIAVVFSKVLSSEPTGRTINYVQQRLKEHEYHAGKPFTITDLVRLFTPELLTPFKETYTEIMGKPPFQAATPVDRELDVIPLVNFAIFRTVQSLEAAEAGLRASLRSRLLRYGH